MATIEVLSLVSLSDADQAAIRGIDPRIALTIAGGWFNGEIRDTWPAFTVRRYLPPDPRGQGTRAERDAMLARAEVVLAGFPFPLDLRARAPRLKWFHQRPAGASNLLRGDLWGSDVLVTTARGLGNTLAIAEYAIAAILHFARGLHHAAIDRQAGAFDHRAYRPLQLAGKTLCVVGAGGIGREVGRLGAALGMRVVGTRRSPGAPPPGFEAIHGPDALHRLLGGSDAVAICSQWTPDSEKMFDRAAFAAMKPGAILVNVARGELIDEAALAEALDADRLRGVALDVYVGEFERPPAAALWADPRVLVTPHISAASDVNTHRGTDLFRENLQAWIEGRPLQNLVDWDRGY